MIYIEDEIHCDSIGPLASFEDAVAMLQRFEAIPWDAEPNRAPCRSWRTCGREYHIVEYSAPGDPPERTRDVIALRVSAAETVWVEGFEEEWHGAVAD